MYNRVDAEVLARLGEIVGPQDVLTDGQSMATYSHDETPMLSGEPEVVVKAGSVEEICAILRLANERLIPVTPRAGGQGLSGGAVPVMGGIVLSVERMNRILEIDHQNLMVTVEPGVITGDLHRAVEAEGFFYPPDPASVYQCTIGGNVATNAGGPRCLKYGVTGDYVLGLEVVVPGGHVLRLGGRTIKNVSGYNLKELFIGSEGTLGVVTEITVRLIPKPAAQMTALAAFPRLADACQAVGNILQAGVVPLVTELMDHATIRAVEDFKHLGLPTDVEALLLVAVDGDADTVVREIAEVAAILQQSGAREVRQAHSAQESEALWEGRRNLSPAIQRLARNKLGEDITVPRSRIPEMVARLGDISRANDLPIIVYGHIGDGNLHPTILCDRRDAAIMHRVEKAAADVLAAAVALGGTLSGEHGIGIFKREHMTLGVDANALAYMAGVKALFDPNGILNPGKKLPE